MDAGGRPRLHPRALRHRHARAHGRRVPRALGLHAAEAGGGEEVARGEVSRDLGQGQGRKGGDTLGGRDGGGEHGRVRTPVFPARGHAHDPFRVGRAAEVLEALVGEQPGQVLLDDRGRGVNTDRLIEFMGSLAKDAPRKVFLMMDILKVHHGTPVKEWLKRYGERIEAFYLPSYSPELKPDERLNADLKHAIATGVPKRTRQGLLKKTQEHMTMVKASPERVKSYFKDSNVAYAADSQ